MGYLAHFRRGRRAIHISGVLSRRFVRIMRSCRIAQGDGVTAILLIQERQVDGGSHSVRILYAICLPRKFWSRLRIHRRVGQDPRRDGCAPPRMLNLLCPPRGRKLWRHGSLGGRGLWRCALRGSLGFGGRGIGTGDRVIAGSRPVHGCRLRGLRILPGGCGTATQRQVFA